MLQQLQQGGGDDADVGAGTERQVSQAVARVEGGETMTVTKHGKIVLKCGRSPRRKQDDPVFRANYERMLRVMRKAFPVSSDPRRTRNAPGGEFRLRHQHRNPCGRGRRAAQNGWQTLCSRWCIANCIVPLQPLGEFCNAVVRKQLLAPGPAAERTPSGGPWSAHRRRTRTMSRRADLCERFELAFFDALIVAVARSAGATILLSEDMQDAIRSAGSLS